MDVSARDADCNSGRHQDPATAKLLTLNRLLVSSTVVTVAAWLRSAAINARGTLPRSGHRTNAMPKLYMLKDPSRTVPAQLTRPKSACTDQKQHVKLTPVREKSMPSSDDRCPTCDGSGSVTRNDQQYPCPTCSPTTDIGRPYLTAEEPGPSSPFRIARSVAYGLGVAAIIGVLAILIKTLWH